MSASSAILRQLTRSAVSTSTKCFSTTPIQISLYSPLTIDSRRSLQLTTGSTIIISRRNMYSNPLAMGNPHFEEEEKLVETHSSVLLHFEAMDRWRADAQRLYELMNTSDIFDEQKQPTAVASSATTQVKSLIEELIEDDLLDPRLSWTATVDH